jgi:hypothetical protein
MHAGRAPSPLAGEGWGEGYAAHSNRRCNASQRQKPATNDDAGRNAAVAFSGSGASGTPLPNPPPQGGREPIRRSVPHGCKSDRAKVMTRFRQMIADLCKVSTLAGLPPPLRGRAGERGTPHTPIDDVQRARAKNLRCTMTRAETLLWLYQAAEQAAPLSLTLSRKGRGNPTAGAFLTDANQIEEES